MKKDKEITALLSGVNSESEYSPGRKMTSELPDWDVKTQDCLDITKKFY